MEMELIQDQDPWSWWSAKLAGYASARMNESTPHPGFYRWVRRQGYGGKRYATPVAYWPGANGELNCRVGDKDVTPERGRDIWIHVGEHPVPEDWYRDVAEHDQKEWRDGLPAAPPEGSNLPPDIDTYEELREAIASLSKQAKKRLEGPPIADQVEADKLANELIDPLADLWKLVEEARKEERKPHDEALKAIQLKWLPLITATEVYKNLKFKLITPWLKRQQETAKKEAEAAAAAGSPAAADTRRPRAGSTGRAISLKVTRRAEITDYQECLKFFADNPDVRHTVQTLADRAVRTGITVPGTQVIEEEKAV